MKIYIVESGMFDDYGIDYYASTREQAEKFIAYNKYSLNSPIIIKEHDVDVPIDESPITVTLYNWVNSEGDLSYEDWDESFYKDEEIQYDKEGGDIYVRVIYNPLTENPYEIATEKAEEYLKQFKK